MNPLPLARVRAALIVAPHPDDETIGAYGLIRTLKARSITVHVVVVTDGAGSHPSSAIWPRKRLIAARRRETLSVMRRICIPAGNVTFLGLPDGALATLPTRLRQALRRTMACHRDVNLLVTPARDDDHPDHRAIAAALPRSPARVLEYLVWPNRQSGSRRASHHLRLGSVAAAKRGAILQYRTQTGMITDDANGFAMSRAELARFTRPVEYFRDVRR